MIDEMEGQVSMFDADGWSGRTCPEPCQAMEQRISKPFSKRQPKWQTKTPAFLDLRAVNGQTQDASWEMDGASLIEYMMPNTGACLKDVNEYVLSLISTETPQEKYYLNCGEKPSQQNPSRLSEILETNPNPKYNLSERACQGILNRAERRGKALPQMLKDALERQAATH